MLINFLRSAFFGVTLLVSTFAVSQEGIDTAPEIKIPDQVNNSGTLNYSVDFETPEFKGLAPNFGLSYSSSNKSLNSPLDVLGVGWKLSGFSSIERVSLLGGIPSFDDKQDIFRLDGSDLLSCTTYSDSYPNARKVSYDPASCSLAGGNMVQRFQPYDRIIRDPAANEFTVTSRDGTKRVYKPLAYFYKQKVSNASNDILNSEYLSEMRWLIAEISRPDAPGRTVVFEYDVFIEDGGPQYLPKTVRFETEQKVGRYLIDFHYTDLSTPISSFGTGAANRTNNGDIVINKNTKQLNAVSITKNVVPIRAYRLEYSKSPAAHRQLLRAVNQIGNNFNITASTNSNTSLITRYISGGSELINSRGSYEFDYNTDRVAFGSPVEFPQLAGGFTQVDFELGGSKELFLPALNKRVGDCDEGQDYVAGFDRPASLWTMSPSRQLSATNYNNELFQLILQNEPIPSGNDQTWGMRNFLSPLLPSEKRLILADHRWGKEYGREGEEYFVDEHRSYLIDGSNGAFNKQRIEVGRSGRNNSGYSTRVTGNFDLDAEPEVVTFDYPYLTINDIGTSAISAQSEGRVDSINDGKDTLGLMPVDVNNDGVMEWVGLPKLIYSYNDGRNQVISQTLNLVVLKREFSASGASGDYIKTVQNNLFGAVRSESVRDGISIEVSEVNGDGLPDILIIANYSGNIYVALGNGKSFSKAKLFTNSVYSLRDSNNNAYSVGFGDLNADGFPDLVKTYKRGVVSQIIKCGVETPYSGKSNIVGIKYSSGTDVLYQANVGATGSGFTSMFDIDGDGQIDLYKSEYEANSNVNNQKPKTQIWFNNSGPANVLIKATTPTGGTFEYEYAPSTTSADDKVPTIRQLVSKITKSDGLGNERVYEYTYTGGRYDYENRQGLGFREVAITLPSLENENSSLVRTAFYNTNSIATSGQVIRTELRYGNSLRNFSEYEWKTIGSGNGPFASKKIKETHSTYFGSNIRSTHKQFEYDNFGLTTVILDLGYEDLIVAGNSDDGTEITDFDDETIAINYSRNFETYQINLPRNLIRYAGEYPGATVGDMNGTRKDDLLSATEHYYEDGLRSVPRQGILKRKRIRDFTSKQNGVLSNPIWKEVFNNELDAYGNIISTTDALGHETVFKYDDDFALFQTTATNVAGHSTSTIWDYGCQSPLIVTNPNGLETKFTYDKFCRNSWKTYPDFQAVNTVYHSIGDPSAQYIETRSRSGAHGSPETAETKLDWFDVKREYRNGFGETYLTTVSGETSEADTANAIYTTYNERGFKSSVRGPMPFTKFQEGSIGWYPQTLYSYDTLDRLVRTDNPDGSFSTRSYWTATHPSSYLNEDDEWTTYYQRLPQTTVRDENCQEGFVDPNTPCGVVNILTDARGQVVRKRYTDSETTDVDSTGSWRATDYRYDLNGNLIFVKDPRGSVWQYTYDLNGNRLVSDDPDLGIWYLEYDELNNLVKQTDAKGQEIMFSYDALNRVLEKRVNWTDELLTPQSDVIHYAYDQTQNAGFNIGYLTEVRSGDDNLIQSYQYGRNGQVSSKYTTVNGRIFDDTFQYRYGGLLKRRTFNMLPNENRIVSSQWGPFYNYDAGNRLISIDGYMTNATYNDANQLSEATFENGIKLENYYDLAISSTRRNWLTKTNVRRGDNSSLFSRIEYIRAPNGKVTSVNTTEAAGDFEYSYDYAGRLLSATNTGEPEHSQSFTYDRAGNMRSNSRIGDYVYPSAAAKRPHAPKSVNGFNLSYDANGNMLTGYDGKAITYDGENRPLSVTKEGLTTTYTYGPDGTRWLKVERYDTGDQITTAYLDGSEIRDFGSDNETVLAYIHPNIRLTNGGEAYGGSTDYMFQDQLGSVFAMLHSDGTPAQRRAYRPFGEIAKQQNIGDVIETETKGFVGERFDEDAGLQYLNARYYDPALGIFIQPDWWEVTKTGVGTNRYSYSFNDPVNLMDPGGNDALYVVEDTFKKTGDVATGTAGLLQSLGDDFDRGRLSTPQEQKAAYDDAIAAQGGNTGVANELTGAAAGAAAGVALKKGRTGWFLGLFSRKRNATNRTDWPELSGSLREASNSATNALSGKGPINFGMGTFSRERTLAMGEAWVGPNYRVTSKGYYESADGLRQFRPPSAKDSPFASTGVQANFEQRSTSSGAWGANGHVNVTE